MSRTRSSAFERVLDSLKRHPIAVVLTLIVAAIGGAASLLSSVESLASFWDRYVRTTDSVEIRDMDVPWSDEKLNEEGLLVRYGSSADAEFALVLHVSASFSRKQFNQFPYLRSVSELDVTIAGDEFARPDVTLATIGEQAIAWTVMVMFDTEPKADHILTFSVGPQDWQVEVGTRSWTAFPYESGDSVNPWHRSQGQLHLPLRDPDWPILRAARFLETKGDGTLLEVLVENRSPEPIPIEDAVIRASHPRTSTDVSCSRPDWSQDVELNWDLLSSKQDASGVWTTLGESQVVVPAEFSGQGRCSGFEFLAAVPVQATIASHDVGRLVFRIKEFPGVRRAQGPGYGLLGLLGMIDVPNPGTSGTPGTLPTWQDCSTSINSREHSVPVYPRLIDVERMNISMPREAPDLRTSY